MLARISAWAQYFLDNFSSVEDAVTEAKKESFRVVPRGIRKKDQPNLSSTIWLTVSDQKNLVYYYQDTNSPGALWVKLDKIDFKEGSGVRQCKRVFDQDF
jgi:penicillin V acylase-like amidase (Ntn superfamily)